ncbi:hypothetical protein GJ496_011662 [Pomphorhynchus laevis]|nr:hypothetical protein GJ496_011662 [Pomphorhynchus laevis]
MNSMDAHNRDFDQIRKGIINANWQRFKATGPVLHSSATSIQQQRRINELQTADHQSVVGRSWVGDLAMMTDTTVSDMFSSSLSCKIFLGGVSWYTNDNDIVQRFLPYGLCHLELPSRSTSNISTTTTTALASTTNQQHQAVASLGFAYLIFENGNCVKKLLSECWRRQIKPEVAGSLSQFSLATNRQNTFYIDLPSSHGSKPVEVIPWALSDNNYFRQGVIPPLDPKRTVFIGNLHGTVRAKELALMIEQIFKCSVEYAGIDVDKYKYPIGSGRVTFQRGADYNDAINTAFVDIRTSRFQKRIQIDPYLEDVICPRCKHNDGSYFCRTCFEYFCMQCWTLIHQNLSETHPKPLARRQKRFLRE